MCDRAGDKPCSTSMLGLHGTTIVNPWSAPVCCDNGFPLERVKYSLCLFFVELILPSLSPCLLLVFWHFPLFNFWNFLAVISFFLVGLNSLRAQDKPEDILLLEVHLFLQHLVISTDSFSLKQDFSSEIRESKTTIILGVTH